MEIVEIPVGITLARYQSGTLVAELKEKNGSREIAIIVSEYSYDFIRIGIEKLETTQPLIFKFLTECLDSLQSEILKIVVTDLANNLFRSHVVIKDARENRTYNIKLHITDALALAATSACPIVVIEEVFQKTTEANSPQARALAAFDALEPDHVKFRF